MADSGGASEAAPVTKRVRRHRDRKNRRRQRWRLQKQRRKKRGILALREQVFRGYDGFVEALIKRRKQLGWSQQELDDRAGFQPGYAGKLEAWRGPSGKVAGSVTMALWLDALGIGFIAVPTVDGTVRDQARELAMARRPRLNGAQLTQRVPAARARDGPQP